MRIVDRYGAERDWAWVQAEFGLVEIAPLTGAGFEIVQLTEIEGPMAFTCALLNSSGAPVAGEQVAYIWPDGENVEITNSLGVAEHSAGSGEGYWPQQEKGPITWEVRGFPADSISGLGWLNGTNHRHLNVTMQWVEDEEPDPGTCDEKLDAIQEDLDYLIGKVDDIETVVISKLDDILVELRRMS